MTNVLGLPGVGSLGATDKETLRDVHCAGWKPIYPSKRDTEETRNAVYAHDEFGEASGCPAFKPN